MDKKALISITSVQDIEDEAIEVVTPGRFYLEDDKFVVIYKETELSGMDGTTTKIIVHNDKVILNREGSTTANMEFEKTLEHVSMYKTPYGLLDMKIKTNDLNVAVDENGGEVKIKYTITVEGNNPISTNLKIGIKA